MIFPPISDGPEKGMNKTPWIGGASTRVPVIWRSTGGGIIWGWRHDSVPLEPRPEKRTHACLACGSGERISRTSRRA